MKRTSLFIALFVFVISSIIALDLSAATRRLTVISKKGQNLPLYDGYHALVVGISDYKEWPDLPYAANDAREVAQRLKEMGFEVKLVLNPDSRELKRAINEMTYGAGRKKNRAVLFYYAGHGETETMADGTKMGYIVPRDCPVLKNDPMGFATHATSMRDIESASLRMRSKHVLMLFDSCFSGALFALIRAVPNDITEKSALPVRQFITAGREDEEVPDRSMFKRCFLIGLKGNADMTGDGYITGSEMGMYLADNVVNYTQRRQHPQYGKINNPDLDQGDFIFIPMKTMDRTTIQKGSVNEKNSLVADIAELKADRVKTRKLLEEMKKLLQVKSEAEEQKEKTLLEKRELERQMALLAKEREKIEQLSAARTKEYETMLAVSKQKLLNEAEKRKSFEEYKKRTASEREELEKEIALLAREAEKKKELERELDRLKREKEKAALQDLTARTLAKGKPGPVASAQPHEVKTAKQPVKKKPSPVKDSRKQKEEVPQREEKIASLHVPKAKPGRDLTSLIVTSNVKDAKIYIDKKEVSFWTSPDEAWIYRGTAPFKTRKIGPGRHLIRVHEEGYIEEVKIVNISPGETLELDVTLFKSLSETGEEDHGGGGGGGGGGGM